MKLFKNHVLLLVISMIGLTVNSQDELINEVTVKIGDSELFSTSSLVNINTKESDFGGYPLGNEMFYCSSKNVLGSIKRIDKNTGKPLYNLYRGLFSGNELTETKLVDKLRKVHAGPVCITPDQDYIFITSDHKTLRDENGNQNLQIYRTKITDEIGESNLETLPMNSVSYSVGHPTVSNDGRTLFFASNMSGGYGGIDLYKLELNQDGSFGEFVNLGANINSSGDECFPWIGEDNMLFFSSNGYNGFGGLDVFVAYETNTEWGNLTNLGESLNSRSDEFAFTLMKDGTTGYFSSNRERGMGNDDIYAFKLLSSLKLSFGIVGVVVDRKSLVIMPGAVVTLLDDNENVIGTTITDEKGQYSFDVDQNKQFVLTVHRDEYKDGSVRFDTDNLISGEPKTVNIDLVKDQKTSLFGLIKDKNSGTPIEGVTVNIVDNMTGITLGDFQTNGEGEVLTDIDEKDTGDRVSYLISISKPGYLSSKQVYNGTIPETGRVIFNDQLDFSMLKVEEGLDLGKLINLNPIYFDLGKYSIRKDASLELDKVVKILNDNPEMVIELGAHTDSRGSASSNLKLSDKRAKSSAKYIKERISTPTRVSGKGYGESQLLNDCVDGKSCPESDHSVNRRTEFKIVN